jgi:hypothetical protein
MITGVIVVLVMVTTGFANNFLNAQLAENEYSSAKQFMLTTGLQVDDVAWTIGRAQTVRYSSRYGQATFESSVLNYTFEVYDSSWHTVLNVTTGIILYNMPTSEITYGNNYFERIFPSNDSFLLDGSAAPVTHVFAVEKLPMTDGSYTRVVVAPSIRMLTSTVGETTYVKFYLPSLSEGTNLYRSQSITLTGNDVTKVLRKDVAQVRISVAFPSAAQGFTQDFFNFTTPSPLGLASNSVVELYVGEVTVSLGLHT